MTGRDTLEELERLLARCVDAKAAWLSTTRKTKEHDVATDEWDDALYDMRVEAGNAAPQLIATARIAGELLAQGRELLACNDAAVSALTACADPVALGATARMHGAAFSSQIDKFRAAIASAEAAGVSLPLSGEG